MVVVHRKSTKKFNKVWSTFEEGYFFSSDVMGEDGICGWVVWATSKILAWGHPIPF